MWRRREGVGGEDQSLKTAEGGWGLWEAPRAGGSRGGPGRCAAVAALLHPPPRSPRTLRLIPALRWDSAQPALLPAASPASPRSCPFPLAKPTFWEAIPPVDWPAPPVHRGGPALPFAGRGGGGPRAVCVRDPRSLRPALPLLRAPLLRAERAGGGAEPPTGEPLPGRSPGSGPVPPPHRELGPGGSVARDYFAPPHPPTPWRKVTAWFEWDCIQSSVARGESRAWQGWGLCLVCSGRPPPAGAARILRGDGGPGSREWPEESRGATRPKRRRECGTAPGSERAGERPQSAGKRHRTDGSAVPPRQQGAASWPRGRAARQGSRTLTRSRPRPGRRPRSPQVTPWLPLGLLCRAGVRAQGLAAQQIPRPAFPAERPAPHAAPEAEPARSPPGGAAASHARCLPRRDPAAGRGGEQKRLRHRVPFPRHTRLRWGKPAGLLGGKRGIQPRRS